jgi:hypothetical protein
MNDREVRQCMFCGHVGDKVCDGLYPEPGCSKPGLDERIKAHSTKPKRPELRIVAKDK